MRDADNILEENMKTTSDKMRLWFGFSRIGVGYSGGLYGTQ
jgi:hypothetical protein